MNKKLYFLAVLPPHEISTEIQNFKKEAQSVFASKHATKSPAHITLVPPFWMDQNSEQFLLESLHELSTQIENFDIELQGFDSFEPNVLFVALSHSDRLIECHRLSKDLIEKLFDQEMKMNHPFHPHMTVAFKDLEPSLLKPALEHFKQKDYRRTFTFQNIELLCHNGRTWQVIPSTPKS